MAIDDLKPCRWRSGSDPLTCRYPLMLNTPCAVTAEHCEGCVVCDKEPSIDPATVKSADNQSRDLPCVYRSEEPVDRISCPTCTGKVDLKIFACDPHEKCTDTKQLTGLACCRICPDYAAPYAFTPQAGDPPCGVVVGTYYHVPLVELQIRVIRHYCGPVPILIADDCSSRREEMRAICQRFADVDFMTGASRIGHSGGDLRAFYLGIAWGGARGLQVIAKASQRWLCVLPRWLQEGSRALLASRAPLACERYPKPYYPIRTEACLLHVSAWNRPEILEVIRPRPVRGALELFIHGCNKRFHGGKRTGWKLLRGDDPSRPNPHVLWHCNTPELHYRNLAKRFGVDLGADFTCAPNQTMPDYQLG